MPPYSFKTITQQFRFRDFHHTKLSDVALTFNTNTAQNSRRPLTHDYLLMDYLTVLCTPQITKRHLIRWLVNNALEKTEIHAVVAYFMVLNQHLL